MLGIAMKSGNLVSGENMTHEAIRNNKAKLVIISNDASDNTKKKFKNASEYYNVPYIIYFDMDTLGRAVGKAARSSMAVTDEGIVKSLKKYIDLEELQYGENEDL